MDFEIKNFTKVAVPGSIDVHVHVVAREDGKFVGDFGVEYNLDLRTGKFEADWGSIRKIGGLYSGNEPPFWMIEEVTEILNETKPGRFRAINSGPSDI